MTCIAGFAHLWMARRMLIPARMIRSLFDTAVRIATAATASAGGFVGLGIGTAPGTTSGDQHYLEDGRSGRLEAGYSFGRIAVEGLVSRFDMIGPDGATYTDTSLGIAGMYTLPLTDGFGVFGRLGYQHTTLSPDDYHPYPSHSGSGILFGGGAEFKLPLAAANLKLFVDYTIARSSVSPESHPDYEYSLMTRTWTLGAKLGF
jgi:hypothetical protein